MNTITLKEPIDFQKYQLIVNFLENIGVEIQAPDYEVLKKQRLLLKKNLEL